MANMPIEDIYKAAQETLKKHKHVKVVNLKVQAKNSEGEDRWYIIAKVRREQDGGVELLVDDLEAYLDQDIWLDSCVTDPYVYFHKRNKPNLDGIEVADGTRDEEVYEAIDISELDPYAKWWEDEQTFIKERIDEQARELREAKAMAQEEEIIKGMDDN